MFSDLYVFFVTLSHPTSLLAAGHPAAAWYAGHAKTYSTGLYPAHTALGSHIFVRYAPQRY